MDMVKFCPYEENTSPLICTVDCKEIEATLANGIVECSRVPLF